MGHSILGWILIGLVAGVLAKLIMPGKDPGGLIVTILIGIVGAVLAGYIGRALHYYQPGETGGWIAGTLGAIVLLVVYRLFMRSRQNP